MLQPQTRTLATYPSLWRCCAAGPSTHERWVLRTVFGRRLSFARLDLFNPEALETARETCLKKCRPFSRERAVETGFIQTCALPRRFFSGLVRD